MRLWLNGRLLGPEDARIDPADRGFLLGDGVFETLRAQAGVLLHLPRHLARLRQGADVLQIALPWTDDALAEAAAGVLAGAEAAVLRITLTRGPGPRGLLPHGEARATVLITAAPLPPAPPPARLIVARRTRRHEHSPLSRIKSLNYLDQIIARQEAAALGADDAVMLNTAGRVACATAGNLFLLIGEAWLTPPTAEGALPGIARGRLLDAGLAREASMTEADMAQARAIVITNALLHRPVCQMEGRILTARPIDRLFL